MNQSCVKRSQNGWAGGVHRIILGKCSHSRKSCARLCHLCTGNTYVIHWLHALPVDVNYIYNCANWTFFATLVLIILDPMQLLSKVPLNPSSHQPEKTSCHRAQHAKAVHNVLETHELREGTPLEPKKHQLNAKHAVTGTETEQWPSQVSGRSVFQ